MRRMRDSVGINTSRSNYSNSHAATLSATLLRLPTNATEKIVISMIYSMNSNRVMRERNLQRLTSKTRFLIPE